MKNGLLHLLFAFTLMFSVTELKAQVLDDFEAQKTVITGTEITPPGGWRYFTADSSNISSTVSRSGKKSLYMVKAGTGWGCGVQYALADTNGTNWTGKRATFWIKLDTAVGTSVNLNLFDKTDGEQWEMKVSPVVKKGDWQKISVNIDPSLFVDNGNGATGDKKLDITKITKINIIVFNGGDTFTRKIWIDDVVAETITKASSFIEDFEEQTIIASASAPGIWGGFSADTMGITTTDAHTGKRALILKKGVTGWGCGVQYVLPDTIGQNWLNKEVHIWVKIDTLVNTTINLNLFDKIDGEQWEQKAMPVLKKGVWQEVVIKIDPAQFVDNGNGGVGDKKLDATKITLINVIIQSMGDAFARKILIDDLSLSSSSVPVELTAFQAKRTGSSVMLNWTTATEKNNKGFEVERSIDNSQFITISYKTGNGTTSAIHNYSFSDDIKNISSSKIEYRLKQIDFDGSYVYSNVSSVETTQPVDFSLSQNFPNPFNPSTTIRFSLKSDSFVKLKIYDVLGNEVKQLLNEQKPAGNYEVKLDASGLASGVYFYKIQAGSFSDLRKMIIMK